MAKRAPKLKFTKEELSNPAVEKAAKKANRRVQKLEQAEAKIPKKKVVEKEPTESRSSSPQVAQPPKKVSSIHFEEKKAPSKLKHTVEVAPVNITVVQLHRQVRKQQVLFRKEKAAHQGNGCSPSAEWPC